MDWATPATFGLKNYKGLSDLLNRLRTQLFGKKTNIAITGMEGVGKTVLLHALTGESRKPDYQKPKRSYKLEIG